MSRPARDSDAALWFFVAVVLAMAVLTALLPWPRNGAHGPAATYGGGNP